MEEFINLIIPISVLSDSGILSLEKLLLLHIISLCKKKDYYWANNEYFKNLFNVSKQTISKSISGLSKHGYIVLEYDKKEKTLSKDADGVELWNGIRCESESMSEDEQKELQS